MRRFIYLDTDTLNSYIAQIYDGLVQTQETETQSSQATDKQSEYTSDLGADADLKVFGKGIEGKMDFTYRHLKETSNTELISDVQTKLLHDNAFDQLMNYLNKNEHLSNHNIGDFIEINDEFYIMDLDYYKKIFNDKKFLDFMKKNDRDKIQALLKIQQDIELEQEGANSNEIKKIYTNLAKSKCAESDKGYDDIKVTYLWSYLAAEVFSKTNDLTLADIVSHIMHVDVVRLNAYIENNLKRTGIYQNKE